MKCRSCGSYKGHHPECKHIKLEDAKNQLVMYYNLWLAFEMRKRELGLPKKKTKGHTAWGMRCPVCDSKLKRA